MSEEAVKNGQTVSVHYVGTLNDGTEFDNSRTRGEAISFQTGGGNVIPGFNNAVIGMQVGETKTVSIDPASAYGEQNPEAVQVIPRSSFPEDMELQPGMQVQGSGPEGEFPAMVDSITDEGVTVNMNHPLAGQTLTFDIELVNISNN